MNTDPILIKELLERGVEDVFIKENLEKKLLSGKKLRVKLGIDPTGPKIHIGRAITLWKLRAFQDLGHQIVLIMGDFTAQVGDASDKLSKRPTLSIDVIKENMKDYKSQIGKILDISKVEFTYNSQWLSKLGFQEIIALAESFSVQQMSNRRNFAERFEKGEEVSLGEFLYPLMQGYDSVAVKADVEIGGFDQLFNLKAGRIIQKHYGQPEQDIMVFKMLEGTDGRKMSTSWGNVITITDEPNDMFGKVMSVKDELIVKYFLLCTKISLSEIEVIKKELENGTNPKDVKIQLAKEIVTLYHGKEMAQKAEEDFENTFKKGGIPEDTKEVLVNKGESLSKIFLEQGIVKSKGELRRLMEEGAVKEVDGGIINDFEYIINKNLTLRVGKRRFIKIKVD